MLHRITDALRGGQNKTLRNLHSQEREETGWWPCCALDEILESAGQRRHGSQNEVWTSLSDRDTAWVDGWELFQLCYLW